MAGKRLTPKLRELVTPDRNARPPVGQLTDAEVDLLGAIAQGQDDFGEPVSAPRAIAALTAGASADVAVPVLASVLADQDAAGPNRIAAARALGQAAGPQAEEALLQHVRDPDPRVQQDVLAALGTFAGPTAADRLKRLPEPGDRATRQQLAFTRALITHRHGLDGPFLPAAVGAKRQVGRPEQMTSVRIDTQTATATAADLATLRGSRYGIQLDKHAFSLQCGPTNWTILVNEELGSPATSMEHLSKRPWIIAIFAQRLPRHEVLITRYVILSRPVDTTVTLDVVRADGTIVYTGTAERADSSIVFEVADVDRPGTAPTNIEGRITPTGVTLDEVIAFATRTGTRESRPVAVDAA